MNKTDLQHFLTHLTEEELFLRENPEYIPTPKHIEMIETEEYGSIFSLSFETEQEKLRKKGLPFTNHFLIARQTRFYEIEMHQHNFVEMFIIYSGSATTIIQGKEVKLRKGNVCILDTAVPHAVEPLGEDDVLINFLMHKNFFTTTILNLLSSNDIISRFLLKVISTTHNHDHYIIFENNDMELLFNHIENLMCEYYSPTFSINEIVNAYMVLIFSELIKNYQRDETESHKLSNQTFIGEIIQYISENYTTCSLNSVAEYFNFHPNYLSRYIKKHIGYSYKTLVQQQRLNQASFLLLNTDLPIGEIADEIGYSNHDFFYQKFKSCFNMTPNQYRQKHRK